MSEHMIPEHNIEFLKNSIEKLNRKALKLNCEPVSLTITTESEMIKIRQSSDYEGPDEFYRAFKCIVEGHAPKLEGGWSFLARSEHTESGNILYIVPGKKVPEEFRNLGNVCDHCHTNRQRVNFYLVQNEQNEIKQIGSSCLSSFLGGKDPESLAQLAEMVTCGLGEIIELAEGEGFEGGGSGRDYTGLKTVLAMTCACIKSFGWVSASFAEIYGKASTKSNVQYQLFSKNIPSKDKIHPSEDDIKEAEKAIEWAKTIDLNDSKGDFGDYMANLKIIALNGFVSSRAFGTACSIMAAYNRAQGVINQYKRKKASEFQGVVGVRQIFKNLTCESVYSSEGNYGTTHINSLVDENSNVFVWMSTTPLHKGHVYSLKGTIKKHNVYIPKNAPTLEIKQTVLTRCKIESESNPEEKPIETIENAGTELVVS